MYQIFLVTDKSRAAAKKEAASAKDDSGTVFQMQRVDMLLAELLRKFPPPIPPIIHQQQIQQQGQQQNPNDSNVNAQDSNTNNTGNNGNNPETSPTGGTNPGLDIKQENVDMKPPPEKKAKAN